MSTLISKILSSLSKDELNNLGVTKVSDYGKDKYRVKRIVVKDEGTPVSFCDIFSSDDYLDLVVATEKDSREQGFAQTAVEKALIWINMNPDLYFDKRIRWAVLSDNFPSIELALRNGFIIDRKVQDESGRTWSHFVLY